MTKELSSGYVSSHHSLDQYFMKFVLDTSFTLDFSYLFIIFHS